ncbi:MAG: ATP-binding protein [Eubacterium sp.]|nr:ATP-binding protein [Eubacterium sp.]
MQQNDEKKVPKYLFGAFCFYLLYFTTVILYLDIDKRWMIVPFTSFILSLFVLRMNGSRVEIQAYTVSFLTFINIFAYSVMLREFTEVFMVFCAAVCLISFYHILKANYLMLGLGTFFIVYKLLCQGEWRNFTSHGSLAAVTIRIFSIYLVQFLLIMLIKRQQNIEKMMEQKAREADIAAQAKEEFLANMSHEIRTPMNAITGMVELALRNDNLSMQDKAYLYNIRTAGEDLLSVVDDILDITKIDSGNFEIIEEEYEITSLIHDAVNVIQVMLGEKPVVLLVNVGSEVPVCLRGDGVRIKQIILNLLTNAVKYTEKGTIRMDVESIPVEGESNKIDLKIRVTDTGIGMTEQQLEDQFTKFKQADSDSGRARGGSGLGLAISKRLAEWMQGTLHAESEPGKGSEFLFTVRQYVVDSRPCIETEPQIVQQPAYQKEDEGLHSENSKKEGRQTTFTAPNTRILLVDDNKVNLKVAEGLLRPYKMCVEMADSGKQAVEMVQKRIYDLVFMDHMMPQMDGVEATKIIRSLDGERFQTMPIIALSANAVRGARELFLEAGMNDFVAKPIEVQTMDSTLRRWLPEDKIISNRDAEGVQPNEEADSEWKTNPTFNPLLWQMEGIDVVVGMSYSGEDAVLYREVLSDYMDTIEEKADVIQRAMEERDLATYTIEVHSLKSTSKSIGALELSELAKELEANGRNGEWEPIIARTPALLSMYRALYHVIMPYHTVKEDTREKKPVDDSVLLQLLGELFDSVNMYDSIRAEEIIAELEEYDLADSSVEHMQAVAETMGRFDYDACKNETMLWRRELQAQMQ